MLCGEVLQRHQALVLLGRLWTFLNISLFSPCRFPKVAFWFICAFMSWPPTWRYCTINLETVWKFWLFPRVHEMSTGLSRASPAFGASANKLRSSKLFLLVQLGLERRKEERRMQWWKEAVYDSGRGVMGTYGGKVMKLGFLCLPSFLFPQALILVPCVLPRVGSSSCQKSVLYLGNRACSFLSAFCGSGVCLVQYQLLQFLWWRREACVGSCRGLGKLPDSLAEASGKGETVILRFISLPNLSGISWDKEKALHHLEGCISNASCTQWRCENFSKQDHRHCLILQVLGNLGRKVIYQICWWY